MTHETFITAASLFGLVKVLFVFCGWLLEPEDRILKKNLDSIWDLLHKLTLYEAAIHTLSKIYTRLESTFQMRRASVTFFWCCIAGSYLVTFITIVLVSAQKETFVDAIRSITPQGYFGILVLTLSFAFLARASLWTTIAFLRHIITGSTLSILILHAFFQVAIVLSTFVLAMAVFHFVLEPWLYNPPLWPGGRFG
jgi:hypothetical protein